MIILYVLCAQLMLDYYLTRIPPKCQIPSVNAPLSAKMSVSWRDNQCFNGIFLIFVREQNLGVWGFRRILSRGDVFPTLNWGWVGVPFPKSCRKEVIQHRKCAFLVWQISISEGTVQIEKTLRFRWQISSPITESFSQLANILSSLSNSKEMSPYHTACQPLRWDWSVLVADCLTLPGRWYTHQDSQSSWRCRPRWPWCLTVACVCWGWEALRSWHEPAFVLLQTSQHRAHSRWSHCLHPLHQLPWRGTGPAWREVLRKEASVADEVVVFQANLKWIGSLFASPSFPGCWAFWSWSEQQPQSAGSTWRAAAGAAGTAEAGSVPPGDEGGLWKILSDPGRHCFYAVSRCCKDMRRLLTSW